MYRTLRGYVWHRQSAVVELTPDVGIFFRTNTFPDIGHWSINVTI